MTPNEGKCSIKLELFYNRILEIKDAFESITNHNKKILIINK